MDALLPWIFLAATVNDTPVSMVALEPTGRIDNEVINESSGLVRGAAEFPLCWTHNDSGDAPRLFAIGPDGTTLSALEGIAVKGAQARDWEAITSDGAGHLIIGDVGNNNNARRDLTLYVVREPAVSATETDVVAKYVVQYPDQEAFPPERRNFDCEALFHFGGATYLLTKHRADTSTKLYALEDPREDRPNTLRLLGEWEIGGQVTGADLTPEGNRLAVLTYDAIWIFERTNGGPSWFEGRARYRAIDARQCEAIAWLDQETLLVTNEQRDVYRVPVSTIPWEDEQR